MPDRQVAIATQIQSREDCFKIEENNEKLWGKSLEWFIHNHGPAVDPFMHSNAGRML